MIVPSIGTSIVALRLTCARLHLHASGASKPREASNASAGNFGSSFSGTALGQFEVQSRGHREVF